MKTTTYTHVTHEFPPLFDCNSEILILGSIPSPKSRAQAFYYGHPQNRFWRVTAAVLGEPVPVTTDEKRAMMLKHHIALWDALEECDICGAGDASIKNAKPTDIPWLLTQTHIKRIYATGAVAFHYYMKYNYPRTGIEAVKLPSTSPANAAVSAEALTAAYQIITKQESD